MATLFTNTVTMKRLDKIILDQGLAASRTQAQTLIKSGAVKAKIHGLFTTLTKASTKYFDDIELIVDSIEELKYVSRAGLKLESALIEMQSRDLLNKGDFSHIANGKTVLDVGQSTGGFTDCLLQSGAQKVVGIDVGHNQLLQRIGDDERVIAYEGINARELPEEELLMHSPGGFDWIVMDVSFISQTLIIPHLANCLKDNGLLISLVKPQFEAGKNHVGKGGIVKDKNVFNKVQTRVCDSMTENGLTVEAYFKSGLTGTDGNREFFAIASKKERT